MASLFSSRVMLLQHLSRRCFSTAATRPLLPQRQLQTRQTASLSSSPQNPQDLGEKKAVGKETEPGLPLYVQESAEKPACNGVILAASQNKHMAVLHNKVSKEADAGTTLESLKIESSEQAPPQPTISPYSSPENSPMEQVSTHSLLTDHPIPPSSLAATPSREEVSEKVQSDSFVLLLADSIPTTLSTDFSSTDGIRKPSTSLVASYSKPSVKPVLTKYGIMTEDLVLKVSKAEQALTGLVEPIPSGPAVIARGFLNQKLSKDIIRSVFVAEKRIAGNTGPAKRGPKAVLMAAASQIENDTFALRKKEKEKADVTRSLRLTRTILTKIENAEKRITGQMTILANGPAAIAQQHEGHLLTRSLFSQLNDAERSILGTNKVKQGGPVAILQFELHCVCEEENNFVDSVPKTVTVTNPLINRVLEAEKAAATADFIAINGPTVILRKFVNQRITRKVLRDVRQAELKLTGLKVTTRYGPTSVILNALKKWRETINAPSNADVTFLKEDKIVAKMSNGRSRKKAWPLVYRYSSIGKAVNLKGSKKGTRNDVSAEDDEVRIVDEMDDVDPFLENTPIR